MVSVPIRPICPICPISPIGHYGHCVRYRHTMSIEVIGLSSTFTYPKTFLPTLKRFTCKVDGEPGIRGSRGDPPYAVNVFVSAGKGPKRISFIFIGFVDSSFNR